MVKSNHEYSHPDPSGHPVAGAQGPTAQPAELSLRLGVSQRHVSFVECGRARPGRELLLEWLRELDVPLSLRNETMLKAGYAPAYSASRLDAPELAQANEALVQLLRAHDPMPAMVMDAEWNVLHMNRGGVWLAMTLMPWAAGLPAGTPFNMLDLLAHPEGFTRSMVNLPEVAPAMMLRLREETAMQPGLSPKVEAIAALLRGRLGWNGWSSTTCWICPAVRMST